MVVIENRELLKRRIYKIGVSFNTLCCIWYFHFMLTIMAWIRTEMIAVYNKISKGYRVMLAWLSTRLYVGIGTMASSDPISRFSHTSSLINTLEKKCGLELILPIIKLIRLKRIVCSEPKLKIRINIKDKWHNLFL